MKGFTKDLDELVDALYDLRKLVANLRASMDGSGGGITPPPQPPSSTGGEGIPTVVEAFVQVLPDSCCGDGTTVSSGCEGHFCGRMTDTNGDGTSDLADYLQALSDWWNSYSGGDGTCTLDKTDVETKLDEILTTVAKIKRWKERGGRK